MEHNFLCYLLTNMFQSISFEDVNFMKIFIEIFILIFGLIVVQYLIFYALNKVSKEKKWKKQIGKGIHHLILAGSITLMVQGFSEGSTHFILRVWIGACLLWILYSFMDPLYFLIRKHLIKNIEKEFQSLFGFIEKLLKLTVLILGGLLIAQNVGFNITSLLAGLGVGGIAIALAAKDALSNFIGSLVIALDRPFIIGDFIHFDQTEGTVENIGIRSTQIKTFYDSTISVPNSVISQAKSII